MQGDAQRDDVNAPKPGGGGQQAEGDALFVAGLLGATLAARKIPAIVALAWDGPQWTVYAVSLGLGATPEQVEALAGALALAAGAESCRVGRQGGRLLLELAKPAGQRKVLRAERLEELTLPRPTAVPLGIAAGGMPVWLDLDDEGSAHTIIGGTTGSGKTVLLRWMLYRWVRQLEPGDLRLLLIDPKRFELRQFEHVPHLLHPVVWQPTDAARVLAWLHEEMERRASSGQMRPRILCVIEETAELLAGNREIGPLLARVAQIGRALGVHLLATTQQPGTKSLGEARINFPTRILGRVASATLTYGAAGRKQSDADALLGRGDFILLRAGEMIRFQAPLLDSRYVTRLPYTSRPTSLEAELPGVLRFVDADRDPRGGRGRRELSEEDYAALESALAEGASVEALRERFGIGWERARRLAQGWREREAGQ